MTARPSLGKKAEMAAADGRAGIAWESGSLDDLLGFLAEGSHSARVHALVGADEVGHIDVIAGGLADARAGDLRSDEAVNALGKRPEVELRVESRLPHPTLAGLDPPGDREGPLGDRPVAALMRYCEEFVLTCALILARNEEIARIVYRRGEITATLVDGVDATHRLPDVMGWTDGTFRIEVEPPELPRKAGAPLKAPAAPAETPTTLFGYPSPAIAALPLGQRPTPRVPPSALTGGDASTRPTPRTPVSTVGLAAATPPHETQAVKPARTDAAATVLAPGSKRGPTPKALEKAPQGPPLAAPPHLTATASAVPAAARIARVEPDAIESGFLAQPVIVHAIVGVGLGLLAVAGYWWYLRAGGAPLKLG
jgi:hypothetical protein